MKDLIYNILIKNTDNVLIQLFRYVFVGGAAFVVDYGLLIFLTEALGLHYIASATISFIAGLTVNYLISTKWIFNKSEIANKQMEFIAYALVGLIGLVLNNVFLWAFTEQIGIPYYFSKPITAALVFLWNFLARRFFIFNAKQTA